MNNELNITSAQYVSDPISNQNSSVKIVVDGEAMFIPLDSDNRHYAEILRQVEAGTLTIQDAD
jgi:hypothetical protein